MDMEYSVQKGIAEKQPKSRPVLVLRKIALLYFALGALLVIFNVIGFRMTPFDLMLEVGFVLAGLQTLFIAAIVHSVQLHNGSRQKSP